MPILINKLKVFSLFTGIGGFELGLKNSNIDYELIGYSEIDPFAIKIFERHFPGIKNYGAATKIRGNEVQDFDLLCAGFPCQAFSSAGQKGGFADTRGTLFFDIARILSYKQPPYLVLENVKGLLSHERGETFDRILNILSDLGYQTEFRVLNSKDFGVPQHRERVYITGYFGGYRGQKILCV